jgi:3-carboxy-cis,cis-muconate cycloisomerase
MRNNLDATHGLIMAEAVTMLLAEKFGKADAHHLVEAACARALDSGAHLADVLAEDSRVTDRVAREELQHAFEPDGYVGESHAVVARVVARAERMLTLRSEIT